ncbi:MAG: hypothetical protein BWY75_02914 [bacterium ADurb.Bin425]|nr:MAG: hypothetical protein BWY75_02914 [bacterium ADurb.Bin425]
MGHHDGFQTRLHLGGIEGQNEITRYTKGMFHSGLFDSFENVVGQFLFRHAQSPALTLS